MLIDSFSIKCFNFFIVSLTLCVDSLKVLCFQIDYLKLNYQNRKLKALTVAKHNIYIICYYETLCRSG